MQVLFITVLINAFHAALEDTSLIAFRRVDVDLFARDAIGVAPFLAPVVDHAVSREVGAKVFISAWLRRS